MNKMPVLVIIEPSCKRKVKNVYKYIIQSQIAEMKTEKIMKYKFGWNGHKFHWDEKNMAVNWEKLSYEATIKMAKILNYKNDSVCAIVLAAIHGVVKRVLVQAGIEHDFVTLIIGESGVGKTALAKIFCEYLVDKKAVYALGSDRKELQKIMQSSNDMTLVIDDFCKSESKRVEERQLQILSELIQGASDAGKLLIRDGVDENIDNLVHIVSISEKMVRNISTINRCFLVRMEEAIEESLWKEILDYKKLVKIFMISFSEFIGNDYDDIVKKCKVDYLIYQKRTNEIEQTEGKSGNRIINTLAVQLTIKQLLIRYFQRMEIDMKLIEKVNKNLESVIYSCIANLKSEIDEILQKNRKMYLLPVLADIICLTDNIYGYALAKTEKKYIKDEGYSNKDDCPYLGICIHSGYISFLPKYMCELIAKRKGIEEVSVRELGKELKEFSLAYIDSQGKMSTQWGSKRKMYHVRVRELIELTQPEEMLCLYEKIIQKYEEV